MTPGKRYATERGFSKLYVSGINSVLANNTIVGHELAEHCFSVYVREREPVCRRRPPCLWDVHVGVTAGYSVQETTHHQTCHCPPPPSWHSYTCRPCFKYTHLQLQTSKLPLRDQLSARESLSCDLWNMGVAHWANLKRWTHLAGVRTVHARTHTHRRARALWFC